MEGEQQRESNGEWENMVSSGVYREMSSSEQVERQQRKRQTTMK